MVDLDSILALPSMTDEEVVDSSTSSLLRSKSEDDDSILGAIGTTAFAVDLDNILALPSIEVDLSSPFTSQSEDDDGVLGTIGTTTTLDNDKNDATISALAMRDSTRSGCFWRPRRQQPWTRWRRRQSAATMNLPMVALCSSPSSESYWCHKNQTNTTRSSTKSAHERLVLLPP
jgi:hypothetical protein